MLPTTDDNKLDMESQLLAPIDMKLFDGGSNNIKTPAEITEDLKNAQNYKSMKQVIEEQLKHARSGAPSEKFVYKVSTKDQAKKDADGVQQGSSEDGHRHTDKEDCHKSKDNQSGSSRRGGEGQMQSQCNSLAA